MKRFPGRSASRRLHVAVRDATHSGARSWGKEAIRARSEQSDCANHQRKDDNHHHSPVQDVQVLILMRESVEEITHVSQLRKSLRSLAIQAPATLTLPTTYYQR